MAYQPAEDASFQAYVTTANLGISGVYTSNVLDLQGYTQVDTHVMADVDGVITVHWYSDSLGVDQVRLLTIPYSAANGFNLLSAPAFTPYVEYKFTNNAVTAQTDFFFETKFLPTSLRPQILGLTALIAGGMVAQLNRSILVGTDVAGAYENVSVAPTTNSSGTSQNLLTVSGARPSQLPGRTAVRIVTNAITLDTLEYTVTSGKTLYITDLLVTVENAANALGTLLVRDGTTVAGPVVLPFFIPDPGAGSTSVTTVSHSFVEPLEFSAGVYWEESNGTLTMSGVMIGYEE
jgi:hypothetical protein